MLDLAPVLTPFPALETPRCTLRAVTPEDTAAFFRLWSDPHVTRYLGRPAMTSLDEAGERMQKLLNGYETQDYLCWAIVHRAGGQLIGSCLLWNIIRQHHRAELGYELASAWWGQGLVPEAAAALLDYAFSAMGLHSVEAKIAPENTASRRVLEKLGFVQEGYFRENYFEAQAGRFTDTAVFSLLKSTWHSRTAG